MAVAKAERLGSQESSGVRGGRARQGDVAKGLLHKHLLNVNALPGTEQGLGARW